MAILAEDKIVRGGDLTTIGSIIKLSLAAKKSIDSIEQTTTSTEGGGVNIITVTFSDGTTEEFEVRNGTSGVSFESIETSEDGTIVITLSDGNTITIDLNHDHPQYPKYELVASEATYEALVTKEPDTLYLIPE